MAKARSEDDRGELVRDGACVYLDLDRLSVRTLNGLLRLCAISEDTPGGGIERYHINETGRALLLPPGRERRARLRAMIPVTQEGS